MDDVAVAGGEHQPGFVLNQLDEDDSIIVFKLDITSAGFCGFGSIIGEGNPEHIASGRGHEQIWPAGAVAVSGLIGRSKPGVSRDRGDHLHLIGEFEKFADRFAVARACRNLVGSDGERRAIVSEKNDRIQGSWFSTDENG